VTKSCLKQGKLEEFNFPSILHNDSIVDCEDELKIQNKLVKFWYNIERSSSEPLTGVNPGRSRYSEFLIYKELVLQFYLVHIA
jgi:hypothetical protein